MKQAKSSSKHSTHLTVYQLHPLRQAVRDAVRSRHPRRQWACGLVAATLICVASPMFGQTLEVSDLDGTNGFKINGETARDNLGWSVSGAGDVNGDGIDDVIIGAFYADSNGRYSGTSYVVFGDDQGFSTPLMLSSLNGMNGFKVIGESAYDRSGFSVSGAGDVNGDGIADVIIGAYDAISNGSRSGAGYVVFGSDQGFSSPIELSGLDGMNGFKIIGESANDRSGFSVSGAGDINGDGIADVIIGASDASSNGSRTGASHVVFGSDQGFNTPLELSSLDGTNGFKLNGEVVGDSAGSSVSAAGDINGDGLDDVIIGAPTHPDGYTGASYVVFGDDQGFKTPVALSSLDGTNGFKLNGESDFRRYGLSGDSVTAAGDVNGDSIDDVIIGAPFAYGRNYGEQGASYVVFGNDQGFTGEFDLDNLDGSNGFKVNGEAELGSFGVSVSGAGDVNGDGISDVIIGAPGYDDYGASYVLFGRNQGFNTPLELSSLDGSNGFQISGEAAVDLFGASVSAAGDVNGDGIDDLIIGAAGADPNGNNSGASYVVFGSPTLGQAAASPMLAALGDINGDGSEDIAVLIHDLAAKTVTATNKDAENGSLIQQINFNGHRTPVAFEVVADIDSNGAPELVVLGQGQGSAKAEVRDSLSSALQSTVTFSFNPNNPPLDLEIVPDQDGNGIPEFAVLSDNPAQVEVRDALTGNLLKTVRYTDNMTPRDLVILPDLNGKGGPEMGVLGEHDNPNKNDRVEIRDLLTGKWVRNLPFGKQTVNQAEIVDDLNNNGTPEVAALRIPNDGKVNVLIKDASTRAVVQGIGFDPNYPPVELLVVPDVNGNGESEIAVFGKNPNNQTQKAQVKDGKTKKRVRNVFFNKAFDPADLVVMPDIDGNGASEIGLLGTRENGGLTRLIIKDSKTGTLVGKVDF